MRLLRFAILSAVIGIAVPTAFAGVQPDRKDQTDHGCAADMNTADCFGDPTTIYGGDFFQCSAKGSLNQGCWWIGEVPDANGVMRKRCVKIAFEGGCSCDSVKLTTKGLCVYYK